MLQSASDIGWRPALTMRRHGRLSLPAGRQLTCLPHAWEGTMGHVSLRRVRMRLGLHLRRWGAHWVVGAGLLAASEMLWRWQTWPVRDMLSATVGTGP